MTVGLTPKVNPGIQTGVTNALGGFNRLNDKKYSYFKADDGDSDYPTRPIILAAGQVLRKGTLLQKGRNGTFEAYGSFYQSSVINISGALAATETLTIAGVIFTANGAVTSLQAAKAFENYFNLKQAGASAQDILDDQYTSLGTWSGTYSGTFDLIVDVASIADADGVASINVVVSSKAAGTPVTAATASENGGLTITNTVKGIPGKATVVFNGASFANTNTIIIGGVTFTAGSAGATPEQIVAAFVAGSVAGGSTVGVLSGTNTGWTFVAEAGSRELTAISTTANTTAGELIVGGTQTAQINVIPVVGAETKVYGILTHDVNATAVDTPASMFIEGDFWYVKDDPSVVSVRWYYVPGVPSTNLGAGVTIDDNGAVDFVANADGTYTACSYYNTGVTSFLQALDLMQNSVGEFNLRSSELKQGELADA